MIQSMTAFARVQKQLHSHLFCWELKSVNHRYLDVSFRLPETLRFLENDLRTLIRGQINRGKLECNLQLTRQVANTNELNIDENLVQALLGTTEKLAVTYRLANDLTVSQVLQWPGVVQANCLDVESLSSMVTQSFEEAISQLLVVRTKEGHALNKQMQIRARQLKEEIAQAQMVASQQMENIRDKLLTRLYALTQAVESTRIEQELALMLTRLDVSEELDRLHIHVSEVFRILENESVVGRRLDFLMQELNREANTLSSKSDSVKLTQHAVTMKVLIEQIREQIQNIE